MNTGTVRVVTFACEEDARQFDRAVAADRVYAGDRESNIHRLRDVECELDPNERISLHTWIIENGNLMAYPAVRDNIPGPMLKRVKRRGAWTKAARKEGLV